MSIIPLFDYIQRNKTVTGFIMPQQQAEQIAQAALQAPINNLIVVGILIALIIVLGGDFLIWKFMPVILKQIQQLIDNNIQLAKIADQNAAAAQLARGIDSPAANARRSARRRSPGCPASCAPRRRCSRRTRAARGAGC